VSITTFATDPDQVRRVLCDYCGHAYIAHPGATTDEQLQNWAEDHGWRLGRFADMCPPCARKNPEG
jgi:hypothetical protein